MPPTEPTLVLRRAPLWYVGIALVAGLVVGGCVTGMTKSEGTIWFPLGAVAGLVLAALTVRRVHRSWHTLAIVDNGSALRLRRPGSTWQIPLSQLDRVELLRSTEVVRGRSARRTDLLLTVDGLPYVVLSTTIGTTTLTRFAEELGPRRFGRLAERRGAIPAKSIPRGPQWLNPNLLDTGPGPAILFTVMLGAVTCLSWLGYQGLTGHPERRAVVAAATIRSQLAPAARLGGPMGSGDTQWSTGRGDCDGPDRWLWGTTGVREASYRLTIDVDPADRERLETRIDQVGDLGIARLLTYLQNGATQASVVVGLPCMTDRERAAVRPDAERAAARIAGFLTTTG